MPLCPHLTRSLALLAATLPTLIGGAFAHAPGEVSVVVSVPDARTRLVPPASFALRMDNYVDVVDSVLNARVRARRDRVSGARPAGSVGASARRSIGAVVETSGSSREDTLHVRRIARPPRLPPGPLVVRTTAAFTGKGAPAGTATWPPSKGRLAISADDGSRIELDADTGDIASVNVTIASGSQVYVFREPWATWAPLVLNDR